jgi:hypothetical protein
LGRRNGRQINADISAISGQYLPKMAARLIRASDLASLKFASPHDRSIRRSNAQPKMILARSNKINADQISRCRHGANQTSLGK